MLADAAAVTVAPTVPAVLAAGFVADDASADKTITFGPQLGSISGSGVNAGGSAFSNTASALLVGGNPTVAVSGDAGAYGQAILDFYFVVHGPASSSVPVQLTGTVSVSRPAGEFSSLQAVIAPADPSLIPVDPMLYVCFGTSDPSCSQGSGTLTKTATLSYTVEANVPQAVFMFAFVDARVARSGSFSAFADPSVVIDPAFAGKDDYQLVFSAGLGPVVPEPGTPALMVAGLFAAFGARRLGLRAPRRIAAAADPSA